MDSKAAPNNFNIKPLIFLTMMSLEKKAATVWISLDREHLEYTDLVLLHYKFKIRAEFVVFSLKYY
jgi:hypothetical protein